MQRPPSIFGTVMRGTILGRPVERRLVMALLVVATSLLAIFPKTYVAQVQLNQPSSNAAGLGALLGQLGGNYAALLGGGQPYEVDLAVGRSIYVQSEVIRQMHLIGQPGFYDMQDALKTIDHITSVDSLRGAIIKITVRSHDRNFALRLTNAYAAVFSQRLAQLGRQQTSYKRGVLNDRLAEATKRLTLAQSAVERFKANNRLPDLENQLSASVSALSGLQATLQQQQANLQALLRFKTPESYDVQVLQAQVVATKTAIASADKNGRQGGRQNAAGLSALANRYIDLQRDLGFAQSLYTSYTKYLEGAAVEDQSASWNLQVLQPPFIENGFSFNRIWLAIVIGLVAIWISLEFYVYAPPMYSDHRFLRGVN